MLIASLEAPAPRLRLEEPMDGLGGNASSEIDSL